MNEHARVILLRGLEAVAWVFRGADGGEWDRLSTLCLPQMSGVLLWLESLGKLDDRLYKTARCVHGSVPGQDPDMIPDRLEAEYVRLFVNHLGGLSVPLCQSCYTGGGQMMGEPAQAMKTRLDRAGLRIDAAHALPPDHVAIELAYLMFLFPEHATWRKSTGIPAESASEFASEVLATWVGKLEGRILQAESKPLFLLAAGLLVSQTEIIARGGL